MESTDHKCEVCGESFTCLDESGDDYKNYCQNCYKKMIQERQEREDIEEHYGL